MLKLFVLGIELYDEESNTFINTDDFSLDLEHSLLSVSKWEAKYQKPFLSPEEKSREEMMDYIKFMVITENVPNIVFVRLTANNYSRIGEYLESLESATTFHNIQGKSNRREVITSELIYYWMVAFNIPFECETWNINRLFTLIRICDIKNSKPKKMSHRELATHNRSLNAQRKAQLGTSG